MKRQSTAAKIGKHAADRAWYKLAERRVKRGQKDVQILDSSGRYADYDADTERHRIITLSGREVWAASLTTAGQSTGDRVAVTGNDRQGYWFKSMPR